ncbi:MAG TPA: enoyl-CoA hydratase/isomerase family protein [Acidimicrobiales bacterium]|nr:enoyl-CoA hydratase/isomerase family protein [Acidimicrobiales bacterium]
MAAVERQIAGAVCRVRLNRPEKLNALDDDVRIGLVRAFEEMAELPDVKVVVLEGAGRAFSAGADLNAAETSHDRPDWATRRHRFGAWNRLLDLMEAVPQVTVAKLHGHVVGGGSLLAVTCDLRIAADDLKLRIPEVAIGVPLTWGGVPRLVREIGLPLARDLVLTGRTMDAEEANSCGFVQRVVPRQVLDAATDDLVETLVAMPGGPLAISRAMFAALGRQQAGPAGWADADLLMWSALEPQGQAADLGYVTSRLNGNGHRRDEPADVQPER